MDYFLFNKYQSIEENVIYSSSIIYMLLDKRKHIDELFIDFAKRQNCVLNLNLERALYLALAFLYSIGKIDFKNNVVSKVMQ